MEIIEDIAIVTEVSENKVLVKMPESDSCASCAVHGICQVGDNTGSHWIETDLKLQVGDKVKIFISPGLKIMSSFIVFLLPVIMMILIYLLLKYLFAASENVSILGSVLSLGLSGLIIYAIDKKWSKKLRYDILERLTEEEYQQEISDENTVE